MEYYRNKLFCYCGINFCFILFEITAVLTVEVAIHGPCCVNKLSPRDEAIQCERRMFSALPLVKTHSFHLFARLSEISVFAYDPRRGT